MPNWCTNNIVIVGDKKQLQKVKAKLIGCDVTFGYGAGVIALEDETTPFCFHHLVPVPKKVATGQYDPVGHTWCCDNWGTKWGACDVQLLTDADSCLHYRFDTAWCPPLPVFNALFAAFPHLKMTVDYDEEDVELHGRLELREGNVKHVKQVDEYWVGGSHE